MNNFILFVLVILVAYSIQQNGILEITQEDVLTAHRKYDIDRNGFLSPSELESYFYKHYMKAFQGIDIDPKFIKSTLQYIQKHDTDEDGISPEELIKAVMKSDNDGKKIDKEPHYYPEQEL